MQHATTTFVRLFVVASTLLLTLLAGPTAHAEERPVCIDYGRWSVLCVL